VVDGIDASPLASTLSPPLCTGWEWPADCCPYYRTAYKKYAKTFVRHHGGIYRPIYDEMVQQLAQGATLSPPLPCNGNVVLDDEHVLSNIIPAFFETLMTLFPSTNIDNVMDNTPTMLEPKSPWKNTVVLRTFGTDLQTLARAVTLFATGRHPRYAHYCNDQLVLEPRSCVLGRWVPRKGSMDPASNSDSSIDAFEYQLWDSADNKVIAAGDAQVLDFIHAHTICGIQDDYDHWDAHNCEPWAGKPVWVGHEPITNDDGSPPVPYHHILLDDNMYDCLLREHEYRNLHSLWRLIFSRMAQSQYGTR
jgi:hypothetical protein